VKRTIFFLLIISICLTACGNQELKRNLEQQQQIIDDLNANVEKLEGKLQTLEQTTKTLQKEISEVKDNVKKTSPAYLEGSIQEGS